MHNPTDPSALLPPTKASNLHNSASLQREDVIRNVEGLLDAEYERGRRDASRPDNKFYTADDLRAMLRKRCDKTSVRAVARDIGIHPTHLSGIMTGKFGIGRFLVKWLGFEPVVLYRGPVRPFPTAERPSTDNSIRKPRKPESAGGPDVQVTDP